MEVAARAAEMRKQAERGAGAPVIMPDCCPLIGFKAATRIQAVGGHTLLSDKSTRMQAVPQQHAEGFAKKTSVLRHDRAKERPPADQSCA